MPAHIHSLTVKLDPSTAKAKSARPTILNMLRWRKLKLHCIAGPMDISKCKIDRGDSPMHRRRGRTGSLTISCCGIFGNSTCYKDKVGEAGSTARGQAPTVDQEKGNSMCNVPVVPLTLVPSGHACGACGERGR